MVKYMVTRLSKPNPVTGKPPKSEKVPGFGQNLVLQSRRQW